MNTALHGVSRQKLERLLRIAFNRPSRGFTVAVSNLNLLQLAGNFDPLCKSLRYEVAHSVADQAGALGQQVYFWLGSWKRKACPDEIVTGKEQAFPAQLQNFVHQRGNQALAQAFSNPATDDTEITAVVLVFTLIYSRAPALDQGLTTIADGLVCNLETSRLFAESLDLAEFGFANWHLNSTAIAIRN